MNLVTHNGMFHCDEVTACVILKTIFPDSTITRTREQELIDEADIVVDVGKIYDPDNNRFDHHQEGCLEYIDDATKWICLSSAGMVYKKYGKQFIKQFYTFEDDKDLDEIYKQFYQGFIQEIDAIDNGVKQSESNLKYWVCTGVSTIINRMNSECIFNDEEQLIRFQEAMEYVYYTAKIILRSIYQRHQTYKNDYNIIVDAFESRNDVDDSGQILLIRSECNNWQKCVVEYEKKHGFEGDNNIKFVIYRSSKEWRIKTISNSFSSRKDILPEDMLMKHLSKPSDLTFVHSKRFLASAKTYGTAVEIGKLSLLN
jgi:uncharacterized UPF0160 family protein